MSIKKPSCQGVCFPAFHRYPFRNDSISIRLSANRSFLREGTSSVCQSCHSSHLCRVQEQPGLWRRREKASVTAAITISDSDSDSVIHYHASKLVAKEGRKADANLLKTISQRKCISYHLENSEKKYPTSVIFVKDYP